MLDSIISIFRKPKVAKLATFKMSGGHMSWMQDKLYSIEENDETIKKNRKSVGLSGSGNCISITLLNKKQVDDLIKNNKIEKMPSKGYVAVIQHKNKGTMVAWYNTQSYD